MSDRATRSLERIAYGQPACAALLVALGRRTRRPKGWRARLHNGWGMTVSSIYPLRDGSGWAVLFAEGCGMRVDDANIQGVYRGGSDATGVRS